MSYVTGIADRVPSGRSTSFSGKTAWVVANLALASGMAAWIAEFNPAGWISNPIHLADTYTPSFHDRFVQASRTDSSLAYVLVSPAVPSMPLELATKFEQAKGLLAQKLQAQESQAQERQGAPAEEQPPLVDQPAPPATAVPVPRSRPVEANLELKNEPPPSAAAPDNRTLLQKLSDLLPARVTLASLAPDGGLFRDGPDLAALGYDNLTAVYDISAHAVYMPNGSKLEAHSGMGGLIDDPDHVDERNVGATPPNVYDLKPRERLFHGVRALRMIPAGDNDSHGRSGLLAHSYMLGPNGDSNGCVSIRNYDKFLGAFNNGEITRLVVVPSLNEAISASRRAASQS